MRVAVCLLAALLLAGACSAAASTVRVTLSGVKEHALKKHAARVSLNGGEHVTYATVTTDGSGTYGSFELAHVLPGSHLVDIALADYAFPVLRVDVSDKGDDRYRVSVADQAKVLFDSLAGAPKKQGAVASVEPLGNYKYFVPREAFSVMSILSNPMVLMMVVMGGLMMLMPYIADPEEIKQQQKDMQNTMNSLQGKGAAATGTQAVKQK
jgi:hypothetical protein